MNSTDTKASCRLPFRPHFLPVAIEFADKGARGFGYGDRETNGLVLAVEELFAFYQRQAARGSVVEIERFTAAGNEQARRDGRVGDPYP